MTPQQMTLLASKAAERKRFAVYQTAQLTTMGIAAAFSSDGKILDTLAKNLGIKSDSRVAPGSGLRMDQIRELAKDGGIAIRAQGDGADSRAGSGRAKGRARRLARKAGPG